MFLFLKFLDKRAIHELIKEVDPMMQIDEEVEDVCCQIFCFVFVKISRQSYKLNFK